VSIWLHNGGAEKAEEEVAPNLTGSIARVDPLHFRKEVLAHDNHFVGHELLGG